jgi:hypothetical protein
VVLVLVVVVAWPAAAGGDGGRLDRGGELLAAHAARHVQGARVHAVHAQLQLRHLALLLLHQLLQLARDQRPLLQPAGRRAQLGRRRLPPQPLLLRPAGRPAPAHPHLPCMRALPSSVWYSRRATSASTSAEQLSVPSGSALRKSSMSARIWSLAPGVRASCGARSDTSEEASRWLGSLASSWSSSARGAAAQPVGGGEALAAAAEWEGVGAGGGTSPLQPLTELVELEPGALATIASRPAGAPGPGGWGGVVIEICDCLGLVCQSL